MLPKPTIGRRAFVPYRLLSLSQIKEAKRALTFKESQVQRMEELIADYDDGNAHRTIVKINEFREVTGGVSLPRQWTVNAYPHITWQIKTTSVKHGIKFPKKIKPRDDKQAQFFADLNAAAKGRGPQDILAIAATGSGKTVAAIQLGQALGYRTLIVVDSNKIAKGWVNNFEKFYGKKWTAKYVGRVQQDKCEYEGKAFSIALAQSLARRDYGHDFYSAFGLLAIDEIQVYAADHFGKVLSQFPCRIRAGFTAEMKGGAFGRMVKAHIGNPRIISDQEVMKPICYILNNKLEKPFYCETDGSLLTNLSKVGARNAKLAGLIYNRGFKRDRNVLVLSNRTAQLVELKRLCAQLGIPKAAMGLHMGEYETDKWQVSYKYEGGLKKQPLCVKTTLKAAKQIRTDFKRGETSEINMPKALAIRLQQGETVDILINKERYKPTQNELDDITNSCQIVFATYEIFSKGVDVPRLDMGVEALPSGNVKQPLGRILRILLGKLIPEWYAIHDHLDVDKVDNVRWATLLNEFFKGKSKTRLGAIKKAHARVSHQ